MLGERILKLYFMYSIQHCFIYCPSDAAVLMDTGFELEAAARLALAAKPSNH